MSLPLDSGATAGSSSSGTLVPASHCWAKPAVPPNAARPAPNTRPDLRHGTRPPNLHRPLEQLRRGRARQLPTLPHRAVRRARRPPARSDRRRRRPQRLRLRAPRHLRQRRRHALATAASTSTSAAASCCEAKQGRRKAGRRAAALRRRSASARTPPQEGPRPRGTTAWDDAMLRARGQAERYARALAAAEGRPPFLVVVDVGHTIELYTEFTQPAAPTSRSPTRSRTASSSADLADPDVRERLPRRLDRSALARSGPPQRQGHPRDRRQARRTGQVARKPSKHHPHDVAQFLMRCLFTMFAEDVEPAAQDTVFRRLARKRSNDPADFQPDRRRPLAADERRRLLRPVPQEAAAVQRRPVRRSLGACRSPATSSTC